MPSISRNQQIAAAIAEHSPDKLYAKNKGMLSMSKSQLHDFASKPVKKKKGFRSFGEMMKGQE